MVRWRLLVSYVCGALPIPFFVMEDSFVIRGCLSIGALICVLLCIAFAQADGAQQASK